ncbi:MAG: transglycosylase domain-containing protein [Clostridiales Family XIII bacterium]|nr:transglycosylase domain-containing protein [Clostridiales Family XIII bacterium]
MADDKLKSGISEKDQSEIAAIFDRFDKIGDRLEKNAPKAPAAPQTEDAEAHTPPSRLSRLERSKGQPRAGGVRVAEKSAVAAGALSEVLAAAAEAARSKVAEADTAPREARDEAGLTTLLAATGTGPSYAWQSPGSGTGSNSGGGAQKGPKGKARKRHRIRWFRLLCFLFLFGAVFCTAAAWLYAKPIIDSTPRIDPDEISSMLTESSALYDDAGNLIDDIYMGDGRRTNVIFSDMPENLIDAFVAIEDKTFWTHHGFNFVRIIGAIRDSVLRGKSISGTSTITQQLARNLWLTDEMADHTMKRKLQEAIIALQLEEHLTKEQIIEAYMNTIPLGNRSFGVQAAAQGYFSKDVQDLSLLECAALASLPQAPTKYALVQTIYREDVVADDPDLLFVGDQYAYVYNDAVLSRTGLVLRFMLEQGYITQAEHDEAANQNLRDFVKPHFDADNATSNYFADYTIQKVVQDLMAQYDIDEDEARQRLYTGGLKIYTTMNAGMQSLIEAEFALNENFPRLTPKKDRAGNILDKNNKILLYAYDNFFDEAGVFTLTEGEYEALPDGGLKLLAGKRLNFYFTQANDRTDYSVEFKDLYVQEDKLYSIIRGGVIPIPSEYKSKDAEGNLIIDSRFFGESGNFRFVDGGIAIDPSSYTLRQAAAQPQAAMVVLDYHTGAIKAMVGGRNTEGRLLYNRATGPRQPGSAIKPMSVYGPALQMGVENEPVTSGEPSYGNYWTAASGIVDEPMTFQGKTWPKNWYSGYRGMQSLRKSVEQSVNVNAVKVQINIGPDRSLRFLKDLGVTSVVETGDTNDMNPAALALGGMTHGISPLQMAAGYGAFGNKGLYVEPMPYSKITNRRGEIIIGREPYKKQAMDEGVAFIMTDILRGVVTNGIAGRAAISSQPVAGKTGTTTEKYDAWFVGFTPQYSASLWIGSDVGIELSEGSGAATKVWSKIMGKICEGSERGSFPSAPSNVKSMTVDAVSGMLPSAYSLTRSEYFIRGTEPTQVDNLSGPVYICPISGYLATPYCPARVPFGSVRVATDETAGGDEDHPEESPPPTGPRPRYYCHLHNGDPERYPIDPAQTLNEDFYWDGVVRDDAYYENQEAEEQAEAGDPAAGAGQGDLPNGQGDASGTGPFPNPIPAQPGQSDPGQNTQGQTGPEQTNPGQSDPGQNTPGQTGQNPEQAPPGEQSGGQTDGQSGGQTAPPVEESTRPSWLPPL